MRLFYAVHTTDLAANPPPTAYHALVAPGAPAWSLIIIDEWRNMAAQDAWEDLPGVIELHPWKWGQIVPAQMVIAFGPFGVMATDTLEQAFRKIRAHWLECRPNR